MDSFYDRLMNLPLFKGAGRELITEVVEKTPLQFQRFEERETIVKPDDKCLAVKCLMTGSVKCETSYYNGLMTISEVIDSEDVIGIENLYGLDTNYNMTVSAQSRCGIMEFTKSSYTRLIQSSQLLLINYINYLSRKAQNGQNALKWHLMRELDSRMSYLVQVTTSPRGRDIRIHTAGESIRAFFENGQSERKKSLDSLERNGLIVFEDSTTIFVPSRSAIIDAFHKE